MNKSLDVPRPVTPEERWIATHRPDRVRVEYRQTGTDTAETYVHLEDGGSKVCWHDTTFNKVARLQLGYNTVAVPAYGIAEAVEARMAFEKKEARDLAEYKRLARKFGPFGVAP